MSNPVLRALAALTAYDNVLLCRLINSKGVCCCSLHRRVHLVSSPVGIENSSAWVNDIGVSLTSLSSSANVMNTWRYISISPYVITALCLFKNMYSIYVELSLAKLKTWRTGQMPVSQKKKVAFNTILIAIFCISKNK